MSSCISAIGTANPTYRVPQQTIYHFMAKSFGLDAVNASRLKQIYDGSGIEYRYSVIPDFEFYDSPGNTFFGLRESGDAFVSTGQRLQLYQNTAIDVAAAAARDCFSFFEGDIAASVTHLITVSCTGMHAPGIDIELIEKLGLNKHTERTCINFMGCCGAINALKVADYICRADNTAKVLVVCIELCTLHFQKLNTLDNWVANSLFSDGAAAALIEHQANKTATGIGLLLENFHSEFVPEARDDMGWFIGNNGFQMKLTSKVSKQIKKNIKSMTVHFLQKVGLSFDEIGGFAMHPGGRSILEAIEDALDIGTEANRVSYEVLNNFGNMSSATILFVLKKVLESKPDAGQNILSYAFGPGLTIEGMLLKAAGGDE